MQLPSGVGLEFPWKGGSNCTQTVVRLWSVLTVSRLHFTDSMRQQKSPVLEKARTKNTNANRSFYQMLTHARSSLHWETVFSDICIISIHHCGTAQVTACVEFLILDCLCEFPFSAPVSSHLPHAAWWTSYRKLPQFWPEKNGGNESLDPPDVYLRIASLKCLLLLGYKNTSPVALPHSFMVLSLFSLEKSWHRQQFSPWEKKNLSQWDWMRLRMKKRWMPMMGVVIDTRRSLWKLLFSSSERSINYPLAKYK